MALRDIVEIGPFANDGMHQAGVGIHNDMHLHAKVPLFAFLDLVHLGVLLAHAVFGRAGRSNRRGIDGRTGLEHQAFDNQGVVDRDQQFNAQLVFFEQVANAQDGSHVRQSGQARTAAFGVRACRRKRLDQPHQFPARYNQVHHIEKHTHARALGDQFKSSGGKAYLLHLCSTSFRQRSC